jgi:putative endonuclease
VECSDGTLYTGITTDINRRLNQHNSGKGAKYTSIRRPVKLMSISEFGDRSDASKEEYRIKQLTRKEKIEYILKQQK